MNDKLYKFKFCISLVSPKWISITRIILTLASNIIGFFLIVLNGKIVDAYGKDTLYILLIYSLSFFFLTEVLSFLNYVFYKKLYRQAFNSLSLAAVKSWYKKSESVRNQYDVDEVITSIKNDCGALCDIGISSLLQIISLFFNLIISVILLCKQNYAFIAVACVFSFIEITQIHKRFFKKQDKYEKENFKTMSDVNIWSIGVFERFEHLKIFNLSNWAREIIINKVQENYDVRTKQSVLNTLISRMKYLPSWTCEALFYVIGGAIIINGKLSLGALVASIGLMGKCINASSNIADFFKNISIRLNSYDRLKNCDVLGDAAANDSDTVCLSRSTGNIEISSVNFSYGDNPVIKNLNMTIPLKGVLLIKGGNGSGKSTLLNLLMGINKPSSGEIVVNGVNTRDFTLDTYNKLYSCVFQDGLIINKSIVENICFFDSVSPGRLEEINNAVFKSSEGLYSREGMNALGDSISGGEKKRVLLARSIYKESKILILDEADTNLDNDGSLQLIELLQKQSNDKLIIIVSHDYDFFLKSKLITHFLDFDEQTLSLKPLLYEV